MSLIITARIPGSEPRTAALSGVLEVTDPDTGARDFAIDGEAAMRLLDAWRSAAPHRGYTCESTGDHDWEWIWAEPTGHGDDRLIFDHWQPASERRSDLPRNRWLLSDFGVAIEVVEVAAGTPETAC